MRTLQIAVFCLALVVFVTALLFAGAVVGDVLWRLQAVDRT
jgi:hypothetical protein